MLECPSVDDLVQGEVTDYCCTLSGEILRRLNLADRTVILEAHVRRFPIGVDYGVFYGLSDVLSLLHGRHAKVWSIRPGSKFFEYEPVLSIEGTASELAAIRPAITGVLTFASSMVTRAHEFVKAAQDRPVHFFGSRKLHPSHVRQYLECAYVGGMEINASTQVPKIVSASKLEDCQEHFANLIADHVEDGWREFVALRNSMGAVFIVLDNLNDPVVEVKSAVAMLGNSLGGVLLDTDSSRRGSIESIIHEIAWHLRLMGREDVRICLTGGVTPDAIRSTRAQVSSYGVGLSALDGKFFDFSLQIVAVDGKDKAKIGVRPGHKSVFVCQSCHRRTTDLMGDQPECCGSPMVSLMNQAESYAPDLESARHELAKPPM